MKPLLKINLDKIGICTSTFCAIHCIITPFILLALPFTSVAFLKEEAFEIGLLLLSLVLASLSLIFSYLKRHGNITPILLAAIGFTCFVLGKLFHVEAIEISCSLIGGLFVILGHYKNNTLLKKTHQNESIQK